MRREEKNAAKRRAIILSALDIFSERGVAAARVEDIARRAGVAKGTIYVHFKDKEDIFAALQEEVLGPVHDAIERTLRNENLTLREKLHKLAGPFLENNGISHVSKAMRLIQAEGLHSPHLVINYRRHICRSVEQIGLHMRQNGMPEALCRHPQLLISPLLHGIIWQGIMNDEGSLDMAAMYQAFLDMVFAD